MNLTLLASILPKDENVPIGTAALLALIGVLIVFVVLIVLMLVIYAMGKIFEGSEKLKEKHPEWNENLKKFTEKLEFWKKKQPETQNEAADEPKANGTLGELTLINTDERDAAMIMAIVADTTNIPLNELRFKSIKRVEEEK